MIKFRNFFAVSSSYPLNARFEHNNIATKVKENAMKITSKLNHRKVFLNLLAGLGTASAVFAQNGPERGTATLSGVQNGGLYDYTITLDNTGTVPIGTFWYAWIPSGFFLPSTPATETAPTGWSATVIGSYSIEYTASSSAYDVGAGSSLNFDFSSTDTPAALAGNSPHDLSYPVGTSYLYEGAAFSDAGYQFVVQSVPEPSALSLLAFGFLGLAFAGHRKLRKTTVAV